LIKTDQKRFLLGRLAGLKTPYPEEVDSLRITQAFLTDPDHLSRPHRLGHLTASAWIADGTGTLALLTHHAKLDMWLQLGGHIEEGETLLESALREAREESGLREIEPVNDEIFDVDAHLIPSRGAEEAHYHYDIRFLFRADRREELVVSRESKDLRWVPLEEIPALNGSPSVLRMARKMHEKLGGNEWNN